MRIKKPEINEPVSNVAFSSASKITRTTRCAMMLLAILLTGGGCAQFEVSKFPWPAKPMPQKPDRIAVMWTDAVMNQPGLPGVRGFGARVMFYDQHHKTPVAVAGRFTVYAYDDTNEEESSQTSADRKFVFTAEQLQDHYSKSGLGHSYSFWIPWDEVGGPQHTITLVCRFESLQGGLVASEPAKQLLPGVPPPKDGQVAGRDSSKSGGTTPGSSIENQNSATSDGNVVRAASYGAAAQFVGQPGPKRHMTTTTIDLPPAIIGRQGAVGTAQYTAHYVGERQAAGMVALTSGQAPIGAQSPPSAQAGGARYVGSAYGAGEPARFVEQQAIAPAAPSVAAIDPQSLAMAAQILAQAMALRQAQAAAPPTAVGYRPPQSRALGAPIQQPRGDHAPRRQHPPGWPSDSLPAPAPDPTAPSGPMSAPGLALPQAAPLLPPGAAAPGF
jgi:hypothetical protein